MTGTTRALYALVACSLLALACQPAAPSPTAAPAKPTEAPKPAQPAGSPAPGAASPAPKPAASPAAQAPTFDERAVADFYRGKTVRIIVGVAAGGLYDVTARIVSRSIAKHIPGNPTVIVENRPGAGGMVAYNAIYTTETKDGTAILTAPPLILAAVMGADGVGFDPSKMLWLGSADKSFSVCMVRTDLGIKSIQDVMNGKEVVLGSLPAGNSTHDVAVVMNSALGTNFKMVPGYDTIAKVRLVIQQGEVDGFCPVMGGALSLDRNILDGENPYARIIVHTSSKVEDHPWLKGVPTAESLAKNEEGRLMLRAIDAQQKMNQPYAVAPEVPPDRVAALRKAMADTFADPQLLADAEQASLTINPNSSEDVQQVVQGLTMLPPDIIAKLKALLRS